MVSSTQYCSVINLSHKHFSLIYKKYITTVEKAICLIYLVAIQSFCFLLSTYLNGTYHCETVVYILSYIKLYSLSALSYFDMLLKLIHSSSQQFSLPIITCQNYLQNSNQVTQTSLLQVTLFCFHLGPFLSLKPLITCEWGPLFITYDNYFIITFIIHSNPHTSRCYWKCQRRAEKNGRN